MSVDVASTRAAADVALLRDLGIEAPPRITWILHQDMDRGPGVAVIGLFSRGKSTLFNALVGAGVAKVDARPATAVITETSTGAPSASAVFVDDEQGLPTDADAFASAVDDLVVGRRPRRAQISGDFRLPAGLRLVDTPGVGAASDLDEQAWYEAGASGAVFVLAVPPGPEGEDWALLGRADDVFGSAVRLVLKATSDDVDDDDLEQVRARAEELCGRPILVAPRNAPPGAWASDPGWKPIEDAITGLAGAGSTASDELVLEIEQWVHTEASKLRSDRLTEHGEARVQKSARSGLPGHSVALRDEVLRLAADLDAADRAAAEQRESERQDHARRAGQRRRDGEQLDRELTALASPVGTSLDPNRFAEAHALVERSSRWLGGSGEFGEAEAVESRVASTTRAILVQVTAISGRDLLRSANALYREPIDDPAAWTATRRGVDGTVRTWLERAVDDQALADLRQRLTAFATDTATLDEAWVEQSHQRILRARGTVRTIRKVALVILWLSVIGLVASLPVACGAVVVDAVATSSSYRTQSTSGGGVVAMLAILTFIVSPFTLVAAGLVRHLAGRPGSIWWVTARPTTSDGRALQW